PWLGAPRKWEEQATRRLVERLELFAQVVQLLLPAARRAEPGEGGREGGVVPAFRDPADEVNHAQRAQRFDQREFSGVEQRELLVAFEEYTQLRLAVGTRSGEQHPDVLDGRPRQAIVEINEVRTRIGPENVAGMAVAVQAQGARGDRLEGGGRAFQRAFAGVQEIVAQVIRQPAAIAQYVKTVASQGLHGQARTFRERSCSADGMDSSDEAAQPFELSDIAGLGCTPAAPRVQREAKAGVFEQAAAVDHERRDHRHFLSCQFQREGVLLENLFVRPALWTVELRDQRHGVLDADLVDAILVAVEREQPAVSAVAAGIHGIEHGVGRQGVVGMCAT